MTDDTHTFRDPWHALRRLTAARIALGRVGDGLPTEHLLDFQMAHAQARDSVHMAFDSDAVAAALADLPQPVVTVHSAAPDRITYLQRPDLGRALAEDDAARLTPLAGDHDVVFVLADGLSARAVHDHGAATLRATLARLDDTWRIGPVVLAHQARVAIGDPVGAALGAALTVVLIGERPGLSSADSLGAYLTWGPQAGRTNADRNCISNIRPEGLPPEAAAHKVAYLMREARHLKLSGVRLKDDAPELAAPDAPAAVAGPEG